MLVTNRLPTDNPAGGIRLGLVRASGVDAARYPDRFEAALATRLAAERAGDPPAGIDAEARRAAARDMLRNGVYKPTGRGKPASEYLVRAASGEDFPRINALVDINNLVSLEERLPISLWDLTRANADAFAFRAGREGEAYVFNAAGQMLDIHDLAVGCASGDRPIVSPIKDSHATKTSADTRDVAVAIYAPVAVVPAGELLAACERFARWLEGCGADVTTATASLEPGGEAEL